MDYRIEELRFILRQDPTSRQFYQLGELLRREGDLDEAVRVLSDGLKHHPAYVAAWVALGRALQQDGRYAQASEAFTRALKIDPENAVAARNLGFVLVELEDWSRAIEAFERAVQLVPGDDALTEALARARARGGQPDGDARIVRELEREPQQLPEDVTGEVGGATDDEAHGQEPMEVEADTFPTAGTEPQAVVEVATRRPLHIDVPDEDPFETVPRGDTGVWVFEGDVFGMVVSASPAGGRVAGGTRPVETSEEAGFEGEDIPFPTATLARLALEQNDLDLAERTARAVLAQNPESSAAREVLAEAGHRRMTMAEDHRPGDLAALKVAALREWLGTVTLAREQRVS